MLVKSNTKVTLHVAVRTLVEYVHRGGDLSVEYSGTARSLEGIRGHQRVQRSRPDSYTPEVAVAYRMETETFFIDISGRIDGVYRTENGVIIDEIKTTVRDPATMAEDQHPVHWAQAKTYGYLYAQEQGLDTIAVQLTYYHLGTGRTREFRQTFGLRELEAFFRELVHSYLDWAATVAKWHEIRNTSIRQTPFPFDTYRPGQRQMAVDIYRTIHEGGRRFVQAATGIGKTMAAVFPAVKAMAEGVSGRLFYLTARTTGRTAAEQALDELRKGGLRFKSVTLTAKDKICFNPDGLCSPDECAFAKGHFDRLGSALERAFAHDALTRTVIETIARDHRVCPFEFSLELSLWADCIVCDYNYAFDPRVYLRRFFMEGSNDHTFLVDEAHNLVDRARDMFSAEIRKQPFLDMRRAVKTELPGIYRQMGKINAHLVRDRKACQAAGGSQTGKAPPETLYPLLRAFLKSTDRWLARNIPAVFRNDLLDLYFTVAAFIRVSEHFDASYAVCREQDGRDLRIKLFCMNPSDQMGEALKRCRTAVFFSATLTPPDYFCQLLGAGQKVRWTAIPSPFPPQHLGLFIADGVSTLYRQREATVQMVAEALGALVGQRQGNYLFFFPSYAYLEMVLRQFKTSEGMEIVVQTPGMSEPERDAFIAGFAENRPGTHVGFAVMGGIFGEGIDLTGNRLTGAAIIGVGLPGISLERELIREYFAATNGAGFEFAYLYPGINRVLQAAGRVIRSRRDRGTVLLIDRRYATRRYTSLFPAEWQPIRTKSPSGIASGLQRFWAGR